MKVVKAQKCPTERWIDKLLNTESKKLEHDRLMTNVMHERETRDKRRMPSYLQREISMQIPCMEGRGENVHASEWRI